MNEGDNASYLEGKQDDFEEARADGDVSKTQNILVDLKKNGFEIEAKFLSSLV